MRKLMAGLFVHFFVCVGAVSAQSGEAASVESLIVSTKRQIISKIAPEQFKSLQPKLLNVAIAEQEIASFKKEFRNRELKGEFQVGDRTVNRERLRVAQEDLDALSKAYNDAVQSASDDASFRTWRIAVVPAYDGIKNEFGYKGLYQDGIELRAFDWLDPEISEREQKYLDVVKAIIPQLNIVKKNAARALDRDHVDSSVEILRSAFESKILSLKASLLTKSFEMAQRQRSGVQTSAKEREDLDSIEKAITALNSEFEKFEDQAPSLLATLDEATSEFLSSALNR